MAQLRLRLRAPDGQHTLSFPSTSTISDLLTEIKQATSLEGELEIRAGVPPKLLVLPPDHSVLASTVVRSGDTLIISKSTSVVPTSSVPSPVARAEPVAAQLKVQAKGTVEGTYEPTVDGNLVIRVVSSLTKCRIGS